MMRLFAKETHASEPHASENRHGNGLLPLPRPIPLPCYFCTGLVPLPRPTYLPLYLGDYKCMSRADTPSISKCSSASQHLTSDNTHFSKNASSICNSHLLVPSSIQAPALSVPRLTLVASSSRPLSSHRNPTAQAVTLCVPLRKYRRLSTSTAISEFHSS